MAETATARIVPIAAETARIVVASILAVACFLRFRGLSWDAGLMLHPDERNLAAAAERLSYPGALVPDFHAYNGLAVYLPRLLAEALHQAGILRTAGLADIAWSARLLSACCALAAVYAIYRIARAVFDQPSAILAAVLAALAPALIQAAHFGTTESVLILTLSLLALVTVQYLDHRIGMRRAAILCGILLGIGLGFKTTAATFALLPLAAFLMRPDAGSLAMRLLWLVVSGLIALAILCLTTPQILLSPQDYFGTMAFEGGVVRGTVDVFWTYQFHDATAVLFELKQIPWLLDPVSALLVLPGLILLLWQAASGRGAARLLLPLLLFGLVYAAIIFSWHAKFMRYLLPLMPVLILAAVAACTGAARHFGRDAGIAVAATMAFSVFVAGSLQAAIYLRTDSRVAGWNYLVSHMQKGDRLVVEPVEVGPPFPGGEHLSIAVTPLPLIEPAGERKIEAIAGILAAGQWMIVSSRRHHGVLPGMRQRFPEMCGYYYALWSGRLGYGLQQRFSRRGRGLLSALDPSPLAEETFSVFDSPTVFVFRNTGRLSQAEIGKEILAAPASCRPAG